jgi:DNA-binding NtrC family response regulator
MDRDQVLLVDPDPERRERLAAALRDAGCHVVIEADPATAESALAEPGFRYLMLDMVQPVLDRSAIRRGLRPDEPVPPGPLEDAERRHIARMLEYTGGNKRRAAGLLGISRSTLLNKIRRYELGS